MVLPGNEPPPPLTFGEQSVRKDINQISVNQGEQIDTLKETAAALIDQLLGLSTVPIVACIGQGSPFMTPAASVGNIRDNLYLHRAMLLVEEACSLGVKFLTSASNADTKLSDILGPEYT